MSHDTFEKDEWMRMKRQGKRSHNKYSQKCKQVAEMCKQEISGELNIDTFVNRKEL
jgi:predicted HicB family RNase H-like nuclease